MVHRGAENMSQRVVGVLGGSGIYDLDDLSGVEEVRVSTPFGDPSDAYVTGRLGDVKMVFLARHGREHRLRYPHEINYRANIYGMKYLGVDWLISLSAVGSMRREIQPGDMVVVDQFIDRTHGRQGSFFGEGVAVHVSLAHPVSPTLANILVDAAKECTADTDVAVHSSGTYLVMNGPQFSTRAESHLYRSWGVDVIGMTNMPEAKLAREAEISYASLALATDYDCWHEEEEDVSVDAVVATLKKNAQRARSVVQNAVGRIPLDHNCIAKNALRSSIITRSDRISSSVRERLALLLGGYVS